MAIDLKSLKPSINHRPPRILVYGGEGIGKSTFFSKAPSPLFIQTEDGTNELNVARYPENGPATSYQQVLDVIADLYQQDHDFKTVVIDSADWLEALVQKHVCQEHQKQNIEEFGYGKGYVFAADAFRELLTGLTALRDKKGMIVGMTAHAMVKRYDDPMAESYDRYQLKMHQKSESLLKEWSDLIGFAALRTMVHSEDVGFNKKAKRAISTGERLLYTQERPAFVAKNRHNLPESLPLEWGALTDCIARSNQTEGQTDNG